MAAPWLLAVGLAAARADDPLELESRRRIYHLVRDYPGLHPNEIARQLGIEANLVSYHLRSLERHGLVSVRREPGSVRYFARRQGRLALQETLTREDKDRLVLLRRPGPLQVVLWLLREDELSLAQLGRRTGLSPATLGYHVASLEKAGLVRSERDGRERRCRLVEASATLRLLVEYRPPDALVAGFLETWQALEAGLERRPRAPS